MVEAGFAEMDLAVDDARENVKVAGLDDTFGLGRVELAEGGDATVTDGDVADAGAVMVDDRSAEHDEVIGLDHGRLRWSLRVLRPARWRFGVPPAGPRDEQPMTVLSIGNPAKVALLADGRVVNGSGAAYLSLREIATCELRDDPSKDCLITRSRGRGGDRGGWGKISR